MAVAPGTRLGVFEVVSLLGEGGMGEVYRARDTKLNRHVALKILPEAFALDGDRIARFRREAQVLAALNHPNIANIYGFEDSGSTHALVLELVEGPTLADRIANGPITLDEALPIAKQIAEALEAAHEQGIIHRDLKPANIKVRDDGTVKVLDFGLAKALEPASAISPMMTGAPTITTPAQMTGVGMILGTAAYMSPEQAKGRPADKRSDVWAFGCVLYEMLTGRRAFEGEDVSDTLAAVLRAEPDETALPPNASPQIRVLVNRCLRKDRRERIGDVAAVRLLLEPIELGPAPITTSSKKQSSSQARIVLGGTLMVGVLLSATAGWIWFSRPIPSPPGLVRRLTLEVAGDQPIPLTDGANIALSPDGRRFALTWRPVPGEPARLYVRRLEELQATPLQGTEGARHPFFSPDGLWVGFFAGGKLKKISVNGGVALTLCDAPDDRGGTWENGWIAFTPRPGDSAIFRVSQDGGTPTALTTLGRGELTHRWPQFLMGGRVILYTANVATGNYEQASLVMLPLEGGAPKTVHRGGYYGRYLPTGHLVYVSQGNLFAEPFDQERLEVTGPAALVVPEVESGPVSGGAQFAFSNDGSLAYISHAADTASPSVYWIESGGKTSPLRAVPANYGAPRFSPDGERLAISIQDQQRDIWVYEWRRGILSRLTTHPALDADPVWTPDGKRIAFRSTRDGIDNIYWQRSDGSDVVQRLTDSKAGQWPMSWHPSGRLLAYREIGRDTRQDIWVLPLEGDDVSGWKPGKPTVLLGGPANESDAVFSPDGRWLAFQSDESGRNEVYVRSFPTAGPRTQVSVAGGLAPRWSSRNAKLFYRTEDGRIMTATYTVAGDSFRADPPSIWSDGPVSAFDVHPDGQRVAVLKGTSPQPAQSGKVVLIVNFFEELRRVSAAIR